MPTGIYKRTEEYRRKLGIAHKGKTTSSVFKKGSIPWNKNKGGYKMKGHSKSIYPFKSKEYRQDEYLRGQYKITLIEYQSLVENQKGRCSICGQLPQYRNKLFVDHNHITGKIRGLLCHSCNIALGLLKDDINIFLSAIDYLKQYDQS